METRPLTKVIFGIGTLLRPKMLKECLLSFRELEIPKNTEVSLLVADNDPEGSAEAVINEVSKSIPISISYTREKTRGIVYMRNKIIEESLAADADLLAFIDDDEVVEPKWLISSLALKTESKSDVVAGRVDRILPDNTPSWVKRGNFFDRKQIATGSIRHSASTSNVIFDLQKLCVKMGLRFHPALNLSGSSDTFLFGQATDKGAKIVWMNESLVKETIPTSRLTVKWQLNRAFRHTNCRTIRSRITNSYPTVLLKEGSYGLLHFFLAVITFPVYLFLGKAGMVHTLRFIWKGAGSFAGLSGIIFEEYKTVHGE